MMNAKLLPCPICGSDVVKCESRHNNYYWYIQCQFCGLTSTTYTDQQQAEHYWNSRLPVLQYGLMQDRDMPLYKVTLDVCHQQDGSLRYALRLDERRCYFISENCFLFEELPSNRNDTYLANTRFATVADALAAWERFKTTDQYRHWTQRWQWIDLTEQNEAKQ